MAENDHPLRPVASAWSEKIGLAWDAKRQLFGDDADEAMKFFDGPYDWMYGPKRPGKGAGYAGDEDELPRPTFCATVNKVAEIVQLFGPSLYHKNPVREVNPRTPPAPPPPPPQLMADPMAVMFQQQQDMARLAEEDADKYRAALLEYYLNWSPVALDLKSHARASIDEALIKGMGVLWHELYTPPTGDFKAAGSFYDTVDNLVVDPDAERWEDIKWVARRCVHPYWEVERSYGIADGGLKKYASAESLNRQGEVNSGGVDGDYKRKQGQTADLLVYWKIYSKMGAGGRLKDAAQSLKVPLEYFGDHAFLAVADNVPFPLNCPPEASQSETPEQLRDRFQWPTPFWADDEWPFTPLFFHTKPGRVWPISHVKPAMGELKFINWAFSFLMGKVRTASRDFLAIAKSASEELKSQITNGPDYSVIEIEQIHESIDKVVQFLQHPPFNESIYKVIDAVMKLFEQRTGLTELMYGTSASQHRSAAESEIKQSQAQIRPDDMAARVEDFMTACARKEAFMARYHLTPADVAPVLGQSGASGWAQYVVPKTPADLLHQLEYRIESGSMRRPDKAKKAADLGTAMTNLAPLLQGWAQSTGQLGPLNNLLSDWATSLELDPDRYLLSPPPMPAMPGAPPGLPAGPNTPEQQGTQP